MINREEQSVLETEAGCTATLAVIVGARDSYFGLWQTFIGKGNKNSPKNQLA